MMHAIASDRVVFPDGLRPGVVHVSGGKIARIEALDRRRPLPEGTSDAGAAAILPGLVDPHVHVNEPGRTEWEGFVSATRAAAAGGVTTLVDMPLNSSPATTCVAALEAKASAAREQCHVDVGFWGGVVPGNEADLKALVEAGVLGFKCFLVPSGIDEFRHVVEHDLTRAMPILASSGATLLVHAEDPSLLRSTTAEDERKYAAYLASRPPECEVSAVTMMIRLAEETGCRVHIVHVSAAECLPILAAARARGIPVTAETCPHYLSFAAEEIPAGATEFKCAPPIRGRANNERLWKGLREGTLDLIASDHSPCPPAMKRLDTGEFPRAWGGIASLQLGLPVVWTESMQRGFGLTEVVRWMSAAPARLCGLHHRKGAIAPGRDADLVVFDTDAAWDVRPDVLHHRHPVTPYVGRRLRGRVLQTYLRGELVYDHGQFSRPRGQWIKQA